MKSSSKACVAALLVLTVSALAYEDLTHQKLTEQACKLASAHGAGSIADDKAHGGFRESIIAGAGSKSGEDYTKYAVHWNCPLEVKSLS